MSAVAIPQLYRQIPNGLTILRFALVPVFVVLMVGAEGGHSWPAGIIFAIAAVTWSCRHRASHAGSGAVISIGRPLSG